MEFKEYMFSLPEITEMIYKAKNKDEEWFYVDV
jgi:hypothetical protein